MRPYRLQHTTIAIPLEGLSQTQDQHTGTPDNLLELLIDQVPDLQDCAMHGKQCAVQTGALGLRATNRTYATLCRY